MKPSANSGSRSTAEKNSSFSATDADDRGYITDLAFGLVQRESQFKAESLGCRLGTGPMSLNLKSVDSGFFSYPYIARDPLLNDLHSEPEFPQIVNMARQRYEAFRRSFFS
jgi:hypothetical protein